TSFFFLFFFYHVFIGTRMEHSPYGLLVEDKDTIQDRTSIFRWRKISIYHQESHASHREFMMQVPKREAVNTTRSTLASFPSCICRRLSMYDSSYGTAELMRRVAVL